MPGCTRLQRVTVMRHSLRADRDGEAWDWQPLRPWDSPLSSRGVLYANAQAAAVAMANPGFSHVVCSPFTRCLQTAAAVLTARELAWQQLTVDYGLSELHMYYGSPRTGMKDWYWDLLAPDEQARGTVSLPVLADKFVAPYWPELGPFAAASGGTFPSGTESYLPPLYHNVPRYVRAFDRIAHTGQDAVVVTHMSGVLSILNARVGGINLYAPQGAFYTLTRTVSPAGKGPWALAI